VLTSRLPASAPMLPMLPHVLQDLELAMTRSHRPPLRL